ncbi:MAG: magnesium transporter [Acidobacteriota bacterium]
MRDDRLKLMLDSIVRLARRGAMSNAVNLLTKLRPVDIAQILGQLQTHDREILFKSFLDNDLTKAAEALSEIETEDAVELLAGLNREDATRLLQELPSDDAAVLVAEMPEESREELLEAMKLELSTDVQELLGFADETAGRIMTPDFFALDEDLTISEAITALQRRSEDFEMAFYLYVIDSRNHLLGVVSLRQLLLNPPSTPLKKIMMGDVIKVTTDTDQEEVARVVATYNLLAIPVVDSENKLVGIITVDDIIDVIREEATEDIYALAGVNADERAFGDWMTSMKLRLPWLALTLGTALLGVAVVQFFIGTIQTNTWLAALIPVVVTMGSYAATQTMTVVVRGLQLGEIDWENSWRVMAKELLVGFVTGVAIALLVFGVIWLWFDLQLGAIIGVTMIPSILLAGLIGTLIPVVLKRFHFDPALASSVFVVTLTDVLALFGYLGIASLSIKYLGK